MNEPIDSIFRRVARRQMVTMLRQALHEIRSYTDIECAIMLAGKDIDARLFFLFHIIYIAEKLSPKQVQSDNDLLPPRLTIPDPSP